MKNLKTIERARREKQEEDIHNNDTYKIQVMLGQNQAAIIAIVELF